MYTRFTLVKAPGAVRPDQRIRMSQGLAELF